MQNISVKSLGVDILGYLFVFTLMIPVIPFALLIAYNYYN
jgi:hypothetical protein